MQNEQRRFEARESFAYAVLTPDEQVELGCVYVYPSSKKGFSAVIRLWVTEDQFDASFDSTLAEPPRGSEICCALLCGRLSRPGDPLRGFRMSWKIKVGR